MSITVTDVIADLTVSFMENGAASDLEGVSR